MYQPTCNDYVLITDTEDKCYLQIGRIVQIITEPFDSYVNTYIIEFYDHHLNVNHRRAYQGDIFENYGAKILSLVDRLGSLFLNCLFIFKIQKISNRR